MPRIGSTACVALSLTYKYGPIAESPSTINNSVPSRFLDVHSTNLDTTDRRRILSPESSLIFIKEEISLRESSAF